MPPAVAAIGQEPHHRPPWRPMLCEWLATTSDLKVTDKAENTAGWSRVKPWNLVKMMIYYRKMMIYHGKMMIYHGKMMIYHGKMMIYHGKMMIYHRKMVVYHRKMVVFHGGWMGFSWDLPSGKSNIACWKMDHWKPLNTHIHRGFSSQPCLITRG